MLTKLATIKTRLKIVDTDVTDDAILTNALAAVSGRFENDCNRNFGLVIAKTEEFGGDEMELRVSTYPIVAGSVTLLEVKENETLGFVAQDMTQLQFVVRKNAIISLLQPLGTEKQIVRVTYSGGFILPDGTSPVLTPPATAPALPSDLEQGAIEQIAYWYQNRNRLGLVAVSGEGGSIHQYAQLDLLPSVKPVLAKYERWMP